MAATRKLYNDLSVRLRAQMVAAEDRYTTRAVLAQTIRTVADSLQCDSINFNRATFYVACGLSREGELIGRGIYPAPPVSELNPMVIQ
jgi:hypothetical protein